MRYISKTNTAPLHQNRGQSFIISVNFPSYKEIGLKSPEVYPASPPPPPACQPLLHADVCDVTDVEMSTERTAEHQPH